MGMTTNNTTAQKRKSKSTARSNGRRANRHNRASLYLPFKQAREFVRSLKLKSIEEWIAYRRSGNKPSNIPGSPEQTYRGEFEGFPDFLGREPRKYLPFQEARQFVHSLKLKTTQEWMAYRRSGNKPSNIPVAPEYTYRGEFKGLPDFLGVVPRRGKYLPFEEARQFVRSLKLKGVEEWIAYRRSGNKPSNIPGRPEYTYRGEFKGLTDFLGTDPRKYTRRKLRPFEQARTFARGLGLRSTTEWKKYVRSGKLPVDIPIWPSCYKEWISWAEFLGMPKYRVKSRPFAEAREFVRSLGLKSKHEWERYCASRNKPADIPSAPQSAYQKEFRGYPDWLGYLGSGNHHWTARAIDAYLSGIESEIPNLRDASLVKLIRQAGLDVPLAQVIEAPSLQQVIDALRNNIGGIRIRLHARGDQPFDAGEIAIAEEEDFQHDEFEVNDDNLHAPDRLNGLVGPDFIEHLVQERTCGLLVRYMNGEAAQVSKLLSRNGGDFFREIKQRFESEVQGMMEVDTSCWKLRDKKTGKPTEPNLMQRFIAHKMETNRTWCNWSGTGAGKTGSAGLAAYVIDSQLTVVLCPNSTVRQWGEELKATFPDSRAAYTVDDVKHGRGSFLLLNYEKFQSSQAESLVEQIASLRPNFLVLDEVQLIKRREHSDSSIRREMLESLLTRLPEAHVLGMTATPVINELSEGVSLLEAITGKPQNLRARRRGAGAVFDALDLHFALLRNGTRYKPTYSQSLAIKTEPFSCNAMLPSLQAVAANSNNVLAIEQAILHPKLEQVADRIKPGTIIYVEFVDGIVAPIREFIHALGLTVGEYIGEADASARTDVMEKFVSGELDVLIGSRPIGLGVDGLQARCNRLILLSLPWTHAAFEQVIGRIYRQGSAFADVEVIIPQLTIDVDGQKWSWDESRYAVIQRKKTVSDAAVDGYLPTQAHLSRTEFTNRALEALRRILKRAKRNDGSR